MSATELERIVKDLTDESKWTWTRVLSFRDAAHRILNLLWREGHIEKAEHPCGGNIWRVNRKLYGRTDGITHAKFRKRRYTPPTRQPNQV